jgi:DHA1 family multidrug resistance protein-like MFS transporter
LYLRHRGGSDALIGAVMASYFVGALLLQYPAGRLADRIGRRPVLLAGLVGYAVGSIGFLLPVSPVVDVALRTLQGAGAGAAEVASLAMISGAVSLERRGRAFGSIYGGQLAGMAVGPLIGSLVGVDHMSAIFVAAAAASLSACIPVLVGDEFSRHGAAVTARQHLERPRLNAALVGAVTTAAALGLVIGVYESCWTLLLVSRGAEQWQIGLSWTLFATPFVAMSRPAGWLADHFDRRRLVIGSLASSIGFCTLYPFVHSLGWLLALGAIEAVGVAIALPSAQSLLTQSSRPSEVGRVQGMFSTSETAAVAVSAAAGGALFAVVTWAPFVAGAAGALVLTASLPIVWRNVAGRVPRAPAAHTPLPTPHLDPRT